MNIAGHIVDVKNERLYDGTIEISNGRISHIEPLEKASQSLPYLMPGLIDAHVHIESTLLLPHNYAPLATRHGVIGAICDPHEIANVLGIEGVEFMLNDAKDALFHFYFCAPSCVPVSFFETAGAKIDSLGVKSLLGRAEIVGLAEMMNYVGVLNKEPDTMAKIAAAKSVGKAIDGHAPGLRGNDAKAYIDAGITTDHECTSFEEAAERLKMGMDILIREGSAARNFDALHKLLAQHRNGLMFCSDDMYPDELQSGYIDEMVIRALAKGMPFWNVLHAACVEPVEHYHLPIGLLQEGDSADFIVVDNFSKFHVLHSFIRGEDALVKEEKTAETKTYPNLFNAHPIKAKDIAVGAPRTPGTQMRVMVAKEGELFTKEELVAPFIEGEHTKAHVQRDLLKLVVLNRYEPATKPAIAFVKGFGLRRGALASSIAHDSHNLIAVGCSDEEIVRALNELIRLKGGLAACDGDKVETLPFPVAGLMSPHSAEKVAKAYKGLKIQARSLGCTFSAPFMTLSFMALPVIPELKLTDKGLFDGRKFVFVDLFAE
ncbi:MAG: adenine deaminase [Bacteroidales bacterium]|nr:adenine deaminase [Bacteroidales bacterium]